ncbi:type III secretion system translocon subunit SctE [Spongorhabdus nitratireducens]
MSGPISSNPGSQIPGFDPSRDQDKQQNIRSTADIAESAKLEYAQSVQRKNEQPAQKNLTISHADTEKTADNLKNTPPRLSQPKVDANDPKVAASLNETLKGLDVKSVDSATFDKAAATEGNAGAVPEGGEVAEEGSVPKEALAGGNVTVGTGKKKTDPTTAQTKAAADAQTAETEEAQATGKAGSDLKTQQRGQQLASQALDIYKQGVDKFKNKPLQSLVFEHHALEVRAQLSGLQDGPPELIKEIEGDLKKLQADIASGKITDPEEATLQLMEMQSKLTDRRMKFSEETIAITKAENQKLHEDRMQKILDTIAKMKKAEKSGLIGKIFGWIAVAVMAVAIVALAASTILTGGATAPALVGLGLMMAGMAIMLTMQISSETGGWMNQIFGDSEKGQLAASIFWAALVTILSVGGSMGVGAAGGAAGAAGSAASTAANAGSTTANTAATASSVAAKAAKMANIVRKVAVLIQAGSQVGQGSAGIATAKYTKDAEILRAEAKEIQAFILRNGQIMEETSEELKKLLEEMQEGIAAMTQIISASHDTKSQISRSMRA